MINICVMVNDYIREAGVMLCSLYENTVHRVDTYILSERLAKEAREKLQEIANKYKQNIYFVRVDIPREEVENISKSNRSFDISILDRLKVADILPADIEKVILLGTDLIFNLDICELWNVDMCDYAVMGVQDDSIGRGLEKYIDKYHDYFSQQTYVNTDMILMNLKKVREKYKLWEQSISFLNSNLDLLYLDQDAINYLFKDSLGLLDKKYNMMTIYLPRNTEKSGIYHFAGDHAIWKDDFARYKFFDYLSKSPWGDECVDLLKDWVKNAENRMYYYRLIIKNTAGRKKCFWGIDGKYYNAIMQYFNVDEEDFFVDANPEKWGKVSHGKEILNPEVLKEQNDVVVIVLIYNYVEVAGQLSAMGLQEDRDFFEGRRVLSPDEGGNYTAYRM